MLLTTEELFKIALDTYMEVIEAVRKKENTKPIFDKLEEKYSDDDLIRIYIMIKEIQCETNIKTGNIPEFDCSTCKHKIQNPYSHHIACGCIGAVVRGDKHGIKNGWFTYPIDFDPVWLKYCDSYEKDED